jgi:hypothetical protein
MADEGLDLDSLEIEAQVQRLQTIADPVARATATELIASVLQLHGAALQRILEILEERREPSITAALDADPLVRSILLLHDLHPQSTAERVTAALRELEGRLKKRDASVELLSLEEGAVKLRLINQGTSSGVEALLEQAIRDAAPEVSGVEIESVSPIRSGFVSIDALRAGAMASAARAQE